MKRQSTDWEKIFTNNVTNKELQTACDTKPHQNKQPTQKCTKEINRHFFKGDIQMAKNT